MEHFGTFDTLKELIDEMILNKTFLLVPDLLEGERIKVTLYEKIGLSGKKNVNDMIVERFLDVSTPKISSFKVISFLHYIFCCFYKN